MRDKFSSCRKVLERAAVVGAVVRKGGNGKKQYHKKGKGEMGKNSIIKKEIMIS